MLKLFIYSKRGIFQYTLKDGFVEVDAAELSNTQQPFISNAKIEKEKLILDFGDA